MGRPPRPCTAAVGDPDRTTRVRADRTGLRRRQSRRRRQRPLPRQRPQTPRRSVDLDHPSRAPGLADRTRRATATSRCSRPAPVDGSAATQCNAWFAKHAATAGRRCPYHPSRRAPSPRASPQLRHVAAASRVWTPRSSRSGSATPTSARQTSTSTPTWPSNNAPSTSPPRPPRPRPLPPRRRSARLPGKPVIMPTTTLTTPTRHPAHQQHPPLRRRRLGIVAGSA